MGAKDESAYDGNVKYIMTPFTPPACSKAALNGTIVSERSSRRPRPVQALECNPPDGAPWPAKCFNQTTISYMDSLAGRNKANLDDRDSSVRIRQSSVLRQTRRICHTHMRDQDEIFTKGFYVPS
jgi:hypothetical protein